MNTTLTKFLLPLLFAVPLACQEEEKGKEPAADLAQLRKDSDAAVISMRDAVDKALVACKGSAVAVELERGKDQGKLFFEVMVMSSDDKLVEVRVDASSGAAEAVPGDEPAEEVAEVRKTLAVSKLSLGKLIGKAEKLLRGKAVAAALEIEDGKVVCDVTFVCGKYLIAADVSATDGKVGEIEIKASGASATTDHEAKGEDDDEEGEEKEAKHGQKNEKKGDEKKEEAGEHEKKKAKKDETKDERSRDPK